MKNKRYKKFFEGVIIPSYLERQMVRKPVNKKELENYIIDFEKLSEDSKNFINTLPEYSSEDLWGTSNITKFLKSFINPPPDLEQVFILHDDSTGEAFLINTEGYDHCRYAASLINF